MSRRKQDEGRYSHLYRIVPAERSEHGWPLCVYCGDPADTTDHVPPISRVEDYRAMGPGREIYLLVKSCRPCNQLIGSDLHADIFERIEAVKYRLKRKMRGNDSALQWSDEELKKLGKNLRSQVIASMRKIDGLQRRIDYKGGYRAILAFIKLQN